MFIICYALCYFLDERNVESRDINDDPEAPIGRCAKKSPRIKSLETTHALLSGSIATCFRKMDTCAAKIFALGFREPGDARPWLSITDWNHVTPSCPFRARMWTMSARPQAPANHKSRRSSPASDAAVFFRRSHAKQMGCLHWPVHKNSKLEVHNE